MKKHYDKEEDILDIEIKEGIYWKSVEIAHNVVLDITKEGEILSIEIFNASKAFSSDLKKVIG